MKKTITVILLCTTVIFAFTSALFAQDGSGVADFLFERAKEYYEQGNYKDALRELEKALIADPGHAQALIYIQIIEKELGPIQVQQKEQGTVPSEQDLEGSARKSAITWALRQAETDEVYEEEVSRELDRIERILLAPLDKFDDLVEEMNEDIAPVEISGEYTVSLGGREDDLIWKEANGDYNETNWRRVSADFGINTYDTRVYDRLRVNIDKELEEQESGFGFHSNITIDPWSFIGKSNEITVTSAAGDIVDVQLRYWSNTGSTINESFISQYSSGVADSFSLPEMKMVDEKVAAFTARGIEYDAGYDTLNIPELEIHRELWPIREFWVDYNSGDKFQLRFFPIAYQDQALSSDDPLQLSGHQIYWEESPWLDRWQPGIKNTGGTDMASEDFTRGEWEDDLSFFTRDSNMTRLTSLRGFSLEANPWENVSIESTVASPKGLWQDYDAFDNVEGATRIKIRPQEELEVGLINTFRYGLQEGEKDAENIVVGADISYQLIPDLEVKGEVAYSHDEQDITQDPYDTQKVGNAYRFELQRGKVQEERPYEWDDDEDKGEDEDEEIEEAMPFDYAVRLMYTHMDKGFYPALANYRLTRKDPFWGRHIQFKQPYKEYYGGLYEPTLTWYDIRAFRIGDSVDINRDVVSLRLEKAFLDGDLETLFDSRNAHEASRGKYIETITRTEANWQANERLLIKFLGIYHDLPDTTGGIDPIIYDVDTNKFMINNVIEDGKDSSLKTVSTGFKYGFFDWLSFDFIYEYTNDFTVGLDDYPRRLLNNPNFTTFTEDGLVWQESEPFLYDQYLFPTPPYPWFNIYKAGLEIEPNEDLKLRLEFTKNDYKFASQIDDNINHLGLGADYNVTDNISLKSNYTYSRSYNLQGRGEGLDYRHHHSVFVNLDYKMEDKGVFSIQFGEAALLPYSTMFTTSPYPGFLPTLDTAHVVRAYFSRKF